MRVSFAVFAVSPGESLRRIYTIRNVSRIKGNGRKRSTHEIEYKDTRFDFILQPCAFKETRFIFFFINLFDLFYICILIYFNILIHFNNLF